LSGFDEGRARRIDKLKSRPAGDHGDRHPLSDNNLNSVKGNSTNLDACNLRERDYAINNSGRVQPNHLSSARNVGRRENLVRGQQGSPGHLYVPYDEYLREHHQPRQHSGHEKDGDYGK